MSYAPHNYSENMAQVIDVTGNNDIVIKDTNLKVLYFTAKWCGPCQRISPIFRELADNNQKINFYKIDVDKNEKLTELFGVKSMPTFFFIKSKTDYKTFIGADIEKLKLNLSYLNSS